MKPPNLWRLLAAAIPSLSAIPAIVALALTSGAGSAAAQPLTNLTPVSKYGCARSEPTIIRPNDLQIPGTNTLRFQGGGGDYPAQGFLAKQVKLDNLFDELIVYVNMAPDRKVDPVLGPINCFEVELPIKSSTRRINFIARLYDTEAESQSPNAKIIHRAETTLFIGPGPLPPGQFPIPFDCSGRGAAPEIMPLADLRIPGINTIRFKYGGREPPLFLGFAKITFEDRGDLLIVNAKYAPQIVIPTGVYTGGCFDVNIPLKRTTRELRMISDLYNSSDVDKNGELSGSLLSSAQTSLFLTSPVTTPAPTLSFWALVALAFGAVWVGFKRLQARRINAATCTSNFALLALALGLLAPPPPADAQNKPIATPSEVTTQSIVVLIDPRQSSLSSKGLREFAKFKIDEEDCKQRNANAAINKNETGCDIAQLKLPPGQSREKLADYGNLFGTPIAAEKLIARPPTPLADQNNNN